MDMGGLGMSVVLLESFHRWVCPNCTQTAVSRAVVDEYHADDPVSFHSKFHICRGLKGLNAPMTLDGTPCKVEARERDDYIGTEDVQTDMEGRPVMSIITTRDEGYDTVVLAPTAHAHLGDMR